MQPPEQGSCLPLDRDAWCQNGGGSGSGWLWWVRRCWNSFHVVVKVWTSQGVMRSHSSRVCRGGLLRIVQVVVPGSNWVLVGVVGWVMDSLMGSRRPAVFIWWCRQQRGWRLGISVVPPVSGWVWWYSWMWSIWLAQEVGRVQPGTAQTGKVRRRYSSISGVGTYRSAGRGRNAPVVGSVRTRCQVFSEPASWRGMCGRSAERGVGDG